MWLGGGCPWKCPAFEAPPLAPLKVLSNAEIVKWNKFEVCSRCLVFDAFDGIGFADRLQVLHGVAAQIAVYRFPDTQQQEGDDRGSGPQLRLARCFRLRFP